MPPGNGEGEAAEEGGPRRGRGGRFVAGGDLRTRYAQIADVLRAADPTRPERVSTRAFDAARSAHHPSLPSARSLGSWLGMSWQEVKDVALSESRDVVRTYGSRHREAARPWRDVEGAVLALKRVAEALGQEELSLTAYDAFRKRSSAATRELLPTSLQIVRLFGGLGKRAGSCRTPPIVGLALANGTASGRGDRSLRPHAGAATRACRA